MKKIIILTLMIGLSVSCVWAATYQINSWNPVPGGQLETVNFLPSPDPQIPCTPQTIGTLYFDDNFSAAGNLMLCDSTGVYTPISGIWEKNGNDVYLIDPADIVGIGTTDPETTLHVAGNGDALFNGTFGAAFTVPAGSGTRMMWIPQKAVFRAGDVSAGQWDAANLGDYSIAFGQDTIASALWSTVGGGYNNDASSNGATIGGGRNNTASEIYTVIGGGRNNEASGEYAVVGGGNTNLAQADYSFIGGGGGTGAAGNTITSTGTHSSILGGDSNTVTGSYSLAVGKSNIVDGNHAYAFGHDIQIAAAADYTFVFNGNQPLGTPVVVSNPNRFIVMADKVGVGTANPTDDFHIYGDQMVIEDRGVGNPPSFILDTTINSDTDDDWELSVQDQKLRFQHDTGGNRTFITRMVITNTGRVGIGTTNPTHTLHVSDTMRVEPRASAPTCDGTVPGALYADDSGALCFCDGATWYRAAGTGTCS